MDEKGLRNINGKPHVAVVLSRIGTVHSYRQQKYQAIHLAMSTKFILQNHIPYSLSSAF